jgi:zinc protease
MKTNSNFLRYSAMCLLAAALAFGQGQPDSKTTPLSKVERKNKAPVSSDILRVKLPKATEIKLDDGLTVLLMEDHRLPTVSVRLIISGAGALEDPADMPGLAGLTASMLKEGTASRTSKQIAEDMEKLGATISASAPYGSTSANITASGLSDNFPQWLALMADMLLNPTFPESELNKLKQRLKVQLQQQRSSPMFLIRERFNRAVYGNHPAAITSPTPESIEKINSAIMAKWHRDRYAPQNAILGIAGDISAADLNKAFEGLPEWHANETKVAITPATKPASGRKIYLVDRPGSVQTDVFIGNITVSRTDPDYLPMVVMDRVVGGGASARLFLNLREEHGYTYGAYSQLIARKFAGPWIAQASMRTDATGGSMTEFMNEINRIRNQAVPEKELEENKRSIVASFALSLEDPDQLLDYALTQKLYDLPPDYWDTYPAKIMTTTAEQVKRVADKYILPDDLQIAVVGDAVKLKPMLEKFGPVEVYDTNGNKK